MNESQAVHSRIYRRRGPAKNHDCVDCGRPARDWSYQYGDPDEKTASTGQRFSEDERYYVPRCRRCHVSFDAKKDPSIPERKTTAALGVGSETRRKAGEAFARRLKEDPEFAVKMEVVRSRASKLGTAASLNRTKCLDCGYESTASAVGRHFKKTNHSRKERVNAG